MWEERVCCTAENIFHITSWPQQNTIFLCGNIKMHVITQGWPHELINVVTKFSQSGWEPYSISFWKLMFRLKNRQKIYIIYFYYQDFKKHGHVETCCDHSHLLGFCAEKNNPHARVRNFFVESFFLLLEHETKYLVEAGEWNENMR